MLALLRRRGLATFALLVVVTEVTGRSLTARLDRALHVAPLANSGADYYPFLLVAVKIVTALALAALLARAIRARATANAGGSLLRTVGHRHDGAGTATARDALAADRARGLRLPPRSSISSRPTPRALAAGRWPLFSPLAAHLCAARSSLRWRSWSAPSSGASRGGCTTSRTSPTARSSACGGSSPARCRAALGLCTPRVTTALRAGASGSRSSRGLLRSLPDPRSLGRERRGDVVVSGSREGEEVDSSYAHDVAVGT